MMPLNTFLSSTCFHTPFLREQGADAGNLLCAEPQQLGHHPSPPGALLGLPASLVRGNAAIMVETSM